MSLHTLASEILRLANDIGQSQSIDEYMEDIKSIFIDKMKKDRSLKNIDPDRIWNSIKNNIRQDVKKQLPKGYAVHACNLV